MTAKELARKGAHVILTARDNQKGLQTVADIRAEIGSNAKIENYILDLSSMENVKNFTTTFLKTDLSIDILVLNAGIMIPPFTLTADDIESQFGVNYLSHFLLVQLLLPRLVESKARVVHVSSKAHETSYSNGISFDDINSEKAYNRV